MDEVSRRVQKACTDLVVSCVAADGASVKSHSATIDVDTAALHAEKEMSIQRGDGMVQNLSTHAIGRVAADGARVKHHNCA